MAFTGRTRPKFTNVAKDRVDRHGKPIYRPPESGQVWYRGIEGMRNAPGRNPGSSLTKDLDKMRPEGWRNPRNPDYTVQPQEPLKLPIGPGYQPQQRTPLFQEPPPPRTYTTRFDHRYAAPTAQGYDPNFLRMMFGRLGTQQPGLTNQPPPPVQVGPDLMTPSSLAVLPTRVAGAIDRGYGLDQLRLLKG